MKPAAVACSSTAPIPEEAFPTVVAEVLERADRDDPVDRLGELLPPFEQYPLGPGTVQSRERLLCVVILILRQRQPDDIDVVAFDGPPHGGAPAAPDVEQCHTRPQAELAERQIDLGESLFERHAVAFEVGATVGLRRIQKQPVEVVRKS